MNEEHRLVKTILDILMPAVVKSRVKIEGAKAKTGGTKSINFQEYNQLYGLYSARLANLYSRATSSTKILSRELNKVGSRHLVERESKLLADILETSTNILIEFIELLSPEGFEEAHQLFLETYRPMLESIFLICDQLKQFLNQPRQEISEAIFRVDIGDVSRASASFRRALEIKGYKH